MSVSSPTMQTYRERHPAGARDVKNPGAIPDAETQAKLTEVEQLAAAERDAHARLEDARHGVEDARERDTKRAADTLRGGAKAGAATVPKFQEALQLAERAVSAVERASADAHQELLGLVAERRALIEREIDQQASALLGDARELAEQALELVRERSRLLRVRGWLPDPHRAPALQASRPATALTAVLAAITEAAAPAPEGEPDPGAVQRRQSARRFEIKQKLIEGGMDEELAHLQSFDMAAEEAREQHGGLQPIPRGLPVSAGMASPYAGQGS